jgi:hypothetical protein
MVVVVCCCCCCIKVGALRPKLAGSRLSFLVCSVHALPLCAPSSQLAPTPACRPPRVCVQRCWLESFLESRYRLPPARHTRFCHRTEAAAVCCAMSWRSIGPRLWLGGRPSASQPASEALAAGDPRVPLPLYRPLDLGARGSLSGFSIIRLVCVYLFVDARGASSHWLRHSTARRLCGAPLVPPRLVASRRRVASR